MKVAVLHEAVAAGARADESDVLDQVLAVTDALDRLGHRHATVAIGGDVDAELRRVVQLAPDVVFNLVESVGGSGRGVDVVPARLAQLGLPYTGCGPAATRLAASKLATKERLTACGLPTPAWWTTTQLRDDPVVPPARYVIKSVWEHGSLGLEADSVVMAEGPATLRDAIAARLERLGGEAFAEAYVHGREFNLGLLADVDGVEHLPAAEIRFSAPAATHIVGYRAKWSPGSPEDRDTPRSFAVTADDAPLVEHLRGLAQGVWDAFGLAGYARIDLRVDSAGRAWIIDVNTNPCLSPGAGFAAALDEAGIPFHDAVQRLLAVASQPRAS